MTISHRTRARPSNSLVHIEDRVSSHNDIDDPMRHWTDVKGRTPASVLTVLLKRKHPGLIEYGGKIVVASTWKHYQAATDTAGKSAADVKRFRFNPAKENESRKHVGSSCSQLLYSIMYYARITAPMDNFRIVEKRRICDKIAGKFYLTREEYIAQRPEWMLERCWEALATEWSSPEFKQRSKTNLANRYSQKFKPHKGGSNSIATIRQKLSKKLGREVFDIEAWIHSHRGSNPEDISSLNTEEASSCLEKYKLKAIELNGPDFDWLHSPVDARALYRCSCGRPHGKWAMFNGVINDNEALPELRSTHANAAAARRQRQEEEERLRKEAHDGRATKEYAQSMFEWGATQVTSHTGMPATAVPSPPAPPPPPPAYVASLSPNPPLDNVGASSVGMETPEETLSRIAYGGYRCHVNATSGGAKLLAAYSYQVAMCTCVVVQFGHFDDTSGVCVTASNEILQLKSIWIDEC
ncbi:unnamed protein product [Miscanthus lutarioriparius]|uniref:Uncharacterized protein n=1 Tax=Miscanthus lutarioriparius TaxID=422564 RepID=A0A811P0R2_9POAL|nr:unnamed protein product [Miscanthus lutarioriparius]